MLSNSHDSPRGRVAEEIYQQAENLDREPHTIGRKSRTNWQREESLAAFPRWKERKKAGKKKVENFPSCQYPP